MKRRGSDRVFAAICFAAAALPLATLALFLIAALVTALPRLDFDFLASYPSRHPEEAGVLPALAGTLYLVTITAVVALPIGVGAAVYMSEYRQHSALARFLELNIVSLAGVPSVLYGLLGLELFVRTVGLGRSVLAGGLTLCLLVFPVVVITTREALRAVPNDLREAALSLGASRWQVIRRVVLPAALPGVLTGSIFALSRAIGEAAPLIALGALAYVDVLPRDLSAPFTALPLQIFVWVARADDGFVVDAAAGIVVLLAVLLVINGFAIVLRHRNSRRAS